MTGEQRIASLLAEAPEVEFALLFGSRAHDRERPGSDWDVAVFVDPELDERERFALRRRLIAALEPSAEMDLVLLNDAPPLLAHRALRGRLLDAKNRARYVRFFVKTLAEAEDESYWSRFHTRARRQRLEEGSFGRP